MGEQVVEIVAWKKRHATNMGSVGIPTNVGSQTFRCQCFNAGILYNACLYLHAMPVQEYVVGIFSLLVAGLFKWLYHARRLNIS